MTQDKQQRFSALTSTLGEGLNAVKTAFDDIRATPGQGALSGLQFAAKDNIDVAGFITGAGNPTWAATHEAAAKHAPIIDMLLDAGAELKAKTHMDELAYSLMGENIHYGTPINTRAKGRVPGGSSSGSASLVGARALPFSLGTDTAGSTRLPASYCGVWGLRTTHGLLSCEGVVPLSKSFDAIGLFASHPSTLSLVVEIFASPVAPAGEMTILEEAFRLVDVASRALLFDAAQKLQTLFPQANPVHLSDGFHTRARDAFRIIQGYEAWEAHGAWIEAARPQFGSGIKERFQQASQVSSEEVTNARATREVLVRELEDKTGDTLICLPTVPGPAPLLNRNLREEDSFRQRAIELLVLAGLSGRPQITLPVRNSEGLPVGLSVIGPRGSDLYLCRLAEKAWTKLGIGGDCL